MTCLTPAWAARCGAEMGVVQFKANAAVSRTAPMLQFASALKPMSRQPPEHRFSNFYFRTPSEKEESEEQGLARFTLPAPVQSSRGLSLGRFMSAHAHDFWRPQKKKKLKNILNSVKKK